MADSQVEIISAATNPQQDDVPLNDARAPEKNLAHNEQDATVNESEIPTKKRKTRRGKSKRKYPYVKNGRKSNKVNDKLVSNKPEAPHNSNQFLLEDHGIIEELDENLFNCDQVSTSTVTRTRDSSFSVDSDGEFYSSPDDEEQFFIKDFDDQYETLQAERLNSMSKNELIQEYMLLQGKLDALTRRLSNVDEDRKKDCDGTSSNNSNSDEFDKLKSENEMLRREIEALRSKTINCSDSADSETDSSESCSSSTSSSSSCTCDEDKSSEFKVTYTNGNSNGHTSPPTSVEPV